MEGTWLWNLESGMTEQEEMMDGASCVGQRMGIELELVGKGAERGRQGISAVVLVMR